ncbi:preprotein translocase subunit SecG [Variovorax sp. VNK109]|jgi:preprotein translocase subunit SecG|uniref:preprotein translocase subunit SecG n=1 Tax=Variovorax sp. VNK109 TaxID=3400919 RepID=UPI003BFE7715
MNFVLNIILAIQLLTAVAMIGLILIQHGKGADMGAAFGGGSSGSLFGASGSANFLSRTTAVLASVFFACTLLLAYFGTPRPSGMGSVLDGPAVTAPAAPSAPVAPPTGAAQIPGNSTPPAATPGAASTPAPAASTVPGPSTAPATGAGQIPTK